MGPFKLRVADNTVFVDSVADVLLLLETLLLEVEDQLVLILATMLLFQEITSLKKEYCKCQMWS